MKTFWKIVRWVGLLVLLVVGYSVYRIGFGKPFTINELANRQAFLFLVKNPELFTGVGIVDGTIFDWHSGKLSPVGVQKRDDDYAMAERFAKQVMEYDRAKLNREDQLTYDILLDQWDTALSFKRFDWLSSEGLYPIAPMWGTQVQLPTFLETVHVVKNAKTARNYVKRLEATGGKLDAVTGEMQRQAKIGVVLPISLLEKAESGIKDTVSPSPPDNPLVTTFVERMKRAKGLDAAEQSDLANKATEAVKNGVYPAYARMTAALESQRPAAAQQAAGVGRLPDGAAYYAAALKQMTTTDYTPEQVHALGLSEAARVSAEMDTLLKSQGLSSGTVAERVQALHKDPRFLLPNTDEGRKQLLTRYQQILDEINARMPEYFRTVPTGKLLVERVPTSAENNVAGAYYQDAAMDGSRPGTFFANLRDVRETATWTMKTLAYHEGIPGHHFQISTAQNLKDLPLIRQQTLYSAYAEGWALYAERFAAEIGMYKDDPFGDVGRLEAELFRAARLVVDTGLHAKGWTREQAITYMVTTTGMNESEVITEVERYMGQPGQACAYKVGQLKILELRERAKAALGAKFNLKDFHAVVLENGGVPLTLLEKLVDEWIAGTKT
ncbi:MAG TPA: DUF885 domain-containing protein [Steroidobacteraceae bacterium]|nr:DUF885 domain-containing protein [Steroidobacteraceae bacterium]